MTIRIDGIEYAVVRVPSHFGYTVHLVPVPDEAWLPDPAPRRLGFDAE